jgi:hypothetical protein
VVGGVAPPVGLPPPGGVPPPDGAGVSGVAGVDGVLVVGVVALPLPFSCPPTELPLGWWLVRRWGVPVVVVPVLEFWSPVEYGVDVE